LCWSLNGDKPAKTQPTYIVPSWSWASVDGQVKYDGQFNADFTTKTIEWDAQVGEVNIGVVEEDVDDFGEVGESSLTFYGQIALCALEVPGTNDSENGKPCQLSLVGRGAWKIDVQPDTLLFSPGKIRIENKEFGSVSRRPHGSVGGAGYTAGELSEEGFVGGVYCLRLGTITGRDGNNGKECIALVLGARPQAAWERLALVDNIPFNFFRDLSRELLEIV
jgi:hypothetical protein